MFAKHKGMCPRTAQHLPLVTIAQTSRVFRRSGCCAGGTRAATAVRSNPETKEASDALLNDILGDLAPAAAKYSSTRSLSQCPARRTLYIAQRATRDVCVKWRSVQAS